MPPPRATHVLALYHRSMARRTANDQASPFNPDHRIYVLHGKEAFLIQQHAQEIHEGLQREHGEIETFRFDGGEAPPAMILDELRSYGLMQQHKVVSVDHADLVVRDENRRMFERYAESPVDHATLILRADSWRAGNLDKQIKTIGAVVKCDPLKEHEAVGWVTKRATAAHGVKIESTAAGMLVERLGTSLVRLDSELGKLAAMVDQGTGITTKHVQEMVGRSREEQAWVIQEAILSGSPKLALERTRDLLDVSRTPEVLLMWAQVDMLRKLYSASVLRQQGVNPQQVASMVKLWGPSRDPMLRVASSNSPDRLAGLLRRAIEVDQRWKSGLANPRRAVQALAVRLADTLQRR